MAHLKDFWQHFPLGISVVVGGSGPDRLLGVRDAFLRYFHDGLDQPVPVAVVPQPREEASTPLPLSDEDILKLARRHAQEQLERHGESYDFVVGSEAGLLTFQTDGLTRHFVRSWTVVLGLNDEAWGSSGSLQLPERLIQGLDDEDIYFAIPGRRRSGGMVSSLTGDLENRRKATALSTFHALSTLLYGVFDSPRPQRR